MARIRAMDSSKIYLACDFGGGSGRVMAGWTDADGQVALEEVHRFANRQVRMGGTLYWDFPALFQDMKDGLRRAAERYGDRIQSIGIDTWGVDFGLIDAQGCLVAMPVCYRDSRTENQVEQYFSTHDRADYYQRTGTQILSINTIFQLRSMVQSGASALAVAEHLLFMPDLLSYYLTGSVNNEYTIASTSGLLNATTRQWDEALIADLGLPRKLFGEIVQPGTSRGRLLPEVAAEVGLSPQVEVIAVASHDTASAVMAVPQTGVPTAWISSGTWSLLGTTLAGPILTEEARLAEFTNEGGADRSITFLSNITGLWILQRLAAEWNTSDWGAMTRMAEAVTAGTVPLIDVDDARFTSPANMAEEIQAATGRTLSQGEMVRCVLESLAERYRRAIAHLNGMLPQPVERLHIIGGGCQNTLLNHLAQERTGLPVSTGPVEATAIGNILAQIHH